MTAAARRGAAAPGASAPGAGAPREGGFTLVELMVSMLVLTICLAITAEVVIAVTHQSTVGLAQGRATDTSQVALDGMAQFIQGAVTPQQAYQANAATDGYVPDSEPPPTMSDCWGSSFPGVTGRSATPQTQLLGQDLTGTTTVSTSLPAYSGAYGTPGPDLVDPSTLSIVYAHDYNLELCAYPPGHSTPQVYELYMPYSSCKRTTGSAPIGDCTVFVVQFTHPYLGTVDYAQPTASNASVVAQVDNVWCDQGCLDALPCTVGCPSTTTNGSCWSYTTVLPGEVVPPPCAGVTTATETQYTPPLFTYLGGTSAASTANVAATNLDLSCQSPWTSNPAWCDPAYTAAASPVCQASASPPAYVTSTDDAVCLTRFSFGSVEVRMTVLGNAASGHGVASSSAPRVAVSQTISLTNLNSEA